MAILDQHTKNRLDKREVEREIDLKKAEEEPFNGNELV